MAAAKVATVACLVCRLCGDIRRLSQRSRKCDCGRCGGSVTQLPGEIGKAPVLRADVWGPCSVIGMDVTAVQTAGMRKAGAGLWWVIPPGAAMKRTDVKS